MFTISYRQSSQIVVIEWLHKQLNEEALSRPLGVTGGFAAIDFEKYTSDYQKVIESIFLSCLHVICHGVCHPHAQV